MAPGIGARARVFQDPSVAVVGSGGERIAMESRLAGRARSEWAAGGGQYEYRVLTIPRSTSRNDARRLLTEEAEYGRWELARTRLFAGGERKVWLRRKIIRVRSTMELAQD
jgi:Family of unknown function (DUF5703)